MLLCTDRAYRITRNPISGTVSLADCLRNITDQFGKDRYSISVSVWYRDRFFFQTRVQLINIILQKSRHNKFYSHYTKLLNVRCRGQICQSSGAVWKSRWLSWAACPNEPYSFCGRKATLNHAMSQFVPNMSTQHPRTLSSTSSSDERSISLQSKNDEEVVKLSWSMLPLMQSRWRGGEGGDDNSYVGGGVRRQNDYSSVQRGWLGEHRRGNEHSTVQFNHKLLTPSPSRARLLATAPHEAMPSATHSFWPGPPDAWMWSWTASPTNSITPVAVPPVTIHAPVNKVLSHWLIIIHILKETLTNHTLKQSHKFKNSVSYTEHLRAITTMLAKFPPIIYIFRATRFWQRKKIRWHIPKRLSLPARSETITCILKSKDTQTQTNSQTLTDTQPHQSVKTKMNSHQCTFFLTMTTASLPVIGYLHACLMQLWTVTTASLSVIGYLHACRMQP